jgi:hypothetical protein
VWRGQLWRCERVRDACEAGRLFEGVGSQWKRAPSVWVARKLVLRVCQMIDNKKVTNDYVWG